MQYATRKDIQDLLELLNTRNDVEIQAKIFSLFACYLVSSPSTHRDLIITSHFVYDKIYIMLTKGLPKMVTVTLNFISALLFDTEDDGCTTKQSLVLHARNMFRVSGCLAFMSNLFNSCMVHQETWTALCRCLTEVCRHSQENQDYCSDLITTAIRRCATGDIESYQVLQSLLHRHDKNIQQFINSNGLTIFKRDKLHNTACLKLVNAVAQNPKAVAILVHNTDVIKILRNFLNLYGKESLIGQWATIILYHIKTFIKDLDKEERNEIRSNVDNRSFKSNDFILNNRINDGDTTVLFQNVYREIIQGQKHDAKLYDVTDEVRNSPANCVKTINNVNERPYVFSIPATKMRASSSRPTEVNRPILTQNKKYFSIGPRTRTTRGDLSFSFLLNKNVTVNKNRDFKSHQRFSCVSNNSSEKEKSFGVTNSTVDINQNIKGNTEIIRSCFNVTKLVDYDEDRTLEFNPTIVSTPKRKLNKQNLFRNHSNLYKSKQEKRVSYDTYKHRKTPTQPVKNKSFSGKFFSAINDSCTMLVKTVKNIFTTKNIDSTAAKEEQSLTSNICIKKAHSNYSFMDYMRRRDAIMGSQCGNFSPERQSGSSCETCNNTILLKRKLEKDYKLKQTLKKLKFGINLYGCDFKKISTTMWPRDSYMTPSVLYNLYRKLIIK